MQPNGQNMKTTHQGLIYNTKLNEQARQAFVVPELTTSPLLSVPTVCDAGYNVTFTKLHCTITDETNKIVLVGKRNPIKKLWAIPMTYPPRSKQLYAGNAITHDTEKEHTVTSSSKYINARQKHIYYIKRSSAPHHPRSSKHQKWDCYQLTPKYPPWKYRSTSTQQDRHSRDTWWARGKIRPKRTSTTNRAPSTPT